MAPSLTRRSLHAVYAAEILALACAFDTHLRFVTSLPLVLIALVLSVSSLRASAPLERHAMPARVWALLAAVVALGVVSPSTGGPAWFEAIRRGVSALALVVVAAASTDDERMRRNAVRAAMAGATLLAFLTVVAIPDPQIDVVPWTRTALAALRHGVHPYVAQADDIYRGGRDFGFSVRVYPYMPATLIALAPFEWVAGDFRYGLACCLPLTLWLVRRTGRRAGVHPQLIDAVTLLIALHPAGPMLVRSGWNEPLLMALAAGVALACVEQARMLSTIGLFLVPMLKQYAIAPALLRIIRRPTRADLTPVIVSACVAGATVLPFMLWNGRATAEGVFFQVSAPTHARITSISFPGLLAATASPIQIPIWLSPLCQVGFCGTAALRGWTTSVPALFAGSAAALLLTFVLGWQAFINYYVCIGLLLVLVAVTEEVPLPWA